ATVVPDLVERSRVVLAAPAVLAEVNITGRARVVENRLGCGTGSGQVPVDVEPLLRSGRRRIINDCHMSPDSVGDRSGRRGEGLANLPRRPGNASREGPRVSVSRGVARDDAASLIDLPIG